MTRDVHVNKPQLLVNAISANQTYVVAGRGVGKSSGIAPYWMLSRIKSMPRSAGFMLGSTYQQILTRTLPPILSTLNSIGYVRGVHYVVGVRPPENWPAQPLVSPEDYKNTVSFANGTIMYLISQDRPGIPNSLSLCWGVVDEAKYIDMDRFNSDLSPAIRGYRHLFGHLAEYQSILWMTDQPTTPEGQWIWEREKLMDSRQIKVIKTIYVSLQDARQRRAAASSESVRLKLDTEVNSLEAAYNQARMNSVLYIEASALDNIDVLGTDYIRRQHQLLPDISFRTSIMNERMTRIEGGFYAYLDDKRHCYDAYDHSYLDTLSLGDEHIADCRHDADIDTTQPLSFACDHGASLNCMVIGQKGKGSLKVLKNLFVRHPQTSEDLALQFCNYYSPLQSKQKRLRFIYDQTAIAQHGKARNINYVQEICAVLRAHGWSVEEVYIGKTPTHSDRYLLSSKVLRPDRAPGTLAVIFNRHNTEELRLAMYTAPAETGRRENEVRKDKRSERDDKLPQEKATHLTDAFDLLLWDSANRQSQSAPPPPSAMAIG